MFRKSEACQLWVCKLHFQRKLPGRRCRLDVVLPCILNGQFLVSNNESEMLSYWHAFLRNAAWQSVWNSLNGIFGIFWLCLTGTSESFENNVCSKFWIFFILPWQNSEWAVRNTWYYFHFDYPLICIQETVQATTNQCECITYQLKPPSPQRRTKCPSSSGVLCLYWFCWDDFLFSVRNKTVQ